MRILGIDEISLTKGQDSYCLVLSDLEQRCVIAVLTDRRQETLEQWLDALSPALEGGFARKVFGAAQAMSSRYVAFSPLFWNALSVLLLVLAKMTDRGNIRQRAGYSLVILLVGLVTLNSIQWSGHFPMHYESLSPLRTELSSPKNDDVLYHLYDWAPHDYIKTQIKVLKKYALSVFGGR